jgi:uncharacterized protein (TIGR01370 family)
MIDTNNINLPLALEIRNRNRCFPVKKRADIAQYMQNIQKNRRRDDVVKKENEIPILNQLTSTLLNEARGSSIRSKRSNNTIKESWGFSFQGTQGKESINSTKGEIVQDTVAVSKKVVDTSPSNDVVVNDRVSRARSESTAIFYGDNLPTDTLSDYKRVIVEADNVNPAELSALREKDSEVFAYVSMGEVGQTRKWYDKVNPDWMLGDNNVWNSKVMDLTAEGWQNFLMDTVISPLQDAGYDGLFLDTMDSFNLFATDKTQQDAQINALSSLMTKIQARYPEMHFISNRGFDVLSSMGDKLDAVVAESLFSSWDNAKKTYVKTSENEQKWLLNKLNDVKKDLSVDIIVIDYAKPNDLQNAKLISDKITQHGFSPWVSIPSLDIIPPSLE